MISSGSLGDKELLKLCRRLTVGTSDWLMLLLINGLVVALGRVLAGEKREVLGRKKTHSNRKSQTSNSRFDRSSRSLMSTNVTFLKCTRIQ